MFITLVALLLSIGAVYIGAIGYRLGRQAEINRVNHLLRTHLNSLNEDAKLQLLTALSIVTSEERSK